MVTVEEATRLIHENLYQPQKEKVEVHQSIGKILAESIQADRDLPPFDRVTMDGIAIRFETYQRGIKTFSIQSTQAAGEPAHILQQESNCIEVMTGAMLPQHTDCIVPYEAITIHEGKATIITAPSGFQNIHRQGLDAKASDVLLSAGQKISPAEVAVIASVGKKNIEVMKSPTIAIVSTGDELVPIESTPKPHQIRRSNDVALATALASMNIPASVFHFRDDEQELQKQLKTVIGNHDVIILSGGVSKGKFDFVPGVLEQSGIRKIFYQISQRPGKPFWFGRSDRQFVFALPGNPVSTYMCFYRYIKPWLRRSMGETFEISKVILAKDFSFKPELTHFLQVRVRNEEGTLKAYPQPGGGSGDFANLKEVDGFLELPKQRSQFQAGEAFDYYPFRGVL